MYVLSCITDWCKSLFHEMYLYLLDESKLKNSQKSIIFQYQVTKLVLLGSPNPKKWLNFGFVGIFEYIILPMLIIFLGMCPNSYGWMPSL